MSMSNIMIPTAVYTADEDTLTLTSKEFSIKALGVDTAELKADAVTSAKIKDGEVTDLDRNLGTPPASIAHWEFDDDGTDETTTYNLTGTANFANTTIKSGTHAIENDATGGRELTHATFLDNSRTAYTTTGFAFSCWLRCTDLSATRTIFQKYNGAGVDTILLTVTTTGILRMNTTVGGTGINLDHQIAINTWYHLTFVWGGEGNVYMYINGRLVAFDFGTVSDIFADGSTGDLNIGADTNGANDWHGQLDLMQFYDRKLTDNEALKVYYNDGGT